jgi:O-acetyl-ADP-ribose deacetylase (regulator of RNase III)
MKITLFDINPIMCDSWIKEFGNMKFDIVCEDVMNIFNNPYKKFDAIVSAANSFGWMDGSLDLVYSRYFGWELQSNLQKAIAIRSMKELLIGEALTVPTGHDRIRYLISAPTMRIGQDVSDTANAYLAFKAALIEAQRHGFQSILCPGLGTAVGRIAPELAAKQMHNAYKEVILNQQPVYREFYDCHLYHVGMTNLNAKRRRDILV